MTDSPPPYTPPCGTTQSTPIIVHLNHCAPGRLNKRDAVTSGRIIEQIKDLVILPDTESYSAVLDFLAKRTEKRFDLSLPRPGKAAVSLVCDGAKISIVDDESWGAAKVMMAKRMVEEVRVEFWFLLETVEELGVWEEKQRKVQAREEKRGCGVM